MMILQIGEQVQAGIFYLQVTKNVNGEVVSKFTRGRAKVAFGNKSCFQQANGTVYFLFR